jgi:hypothetical protein
MQNSLVNNEKVIFFSKKNYLHVSLPQLEQPSKTSPTNFEQRKKYGATELSRNQAKKASQYYNRY